MIQKAVCAEGGIARPLVLHADNASPMKGATMKVTMEQLGITASCILKLNVQKCKVLAVLFNFRQSLGRTGSPALEFFETPLKTGTKGMIEVFHDGTKEG